MLNDLRDKIMFQLKQKGYLMGRGRRRSYAKLVDLLKNRWRAKSFDELLEHNPWGVCGQYRCEAEGLWDTLKDLKIESMVEIGRNLGGGLFLFISMLPDLKKVLSIDIDKRDPTDNEFPGYLDHFGIENEIIVIDSTKYEPYDYLWDFVYIDGGHEREAIRKDIDIWKNRTKYIGFHDFADLGSKNKHKRKHSGVVKEISKAEEKFGWKRIGRRGRSEIVFDTGNR